MDHRLLNQETTKAITFFLESMPMPTCSKIGLQSNCHQLWIRYNNGEDDFQCKVWALWVCCHVVLEYKCPYILWRSWLGCWQEYLVVFVIVCIDDILVYSKFKEDYRVYLGVIYILDALRKNSYTQSWGKWAFWVSKVSTLGSCDWLIWYFGAIFCLWWNCQDQLMSWAH